MRPRPGLRSAALPALLGLLIAAPAALAGVWVVDAGGGGDFTTPGAAIGAAADGDIIVIKPANYSASALLLDLGGKALVIVGDTGGTTTIPPMTVGGLAAGKTAVLRHLSFAPNTALSLIGGTVLVSGDQGRVHIEDCILTGLDGAGGFQGVTATAGLPGLRLVGGATVAVHRSTITGGRGVSTNTLRLPARPAGHERRRQRDQRGGRPALAASGDGDGRPRRLGRRHRGPG